ncbi:MAG: alkaline phosphatase [Bacteroidaceae bacterium]|nr:alkaline phosphatase [Bacteroidaceae bacterium]
MKRFYLSALLGAFLMLLLPAYFQAKTPSTPKYIFYFIGDGMGVNQVNAAEIYLGQIEGKYGTSPLCFSSFPFTAFVTTYSASSGVTDSAAAGTALASGQKTQNGALGLDATLENPVNSIAWTAKQKGLAVGVTTTVTTDHATPAAFYAHTKSRNDKDIIRQQRADCGYDFIMGAPDDGRIPYRLDRRPGELSQADIVRMAIDSLMHVNPQGFFLMSEGGMIDYACHSNDAAAMIGETLDFDDAIREAYQFYQQHPDETLIVVSADHETGGLVLTHGKYEIHLDRLQHQHMTIYQLGSAMNDLRKSLDGALEWSQVQTFLKANFGLGEALPLTQSQQKRLKEAFENTEKGSGQGQKTLYQEDSEFCVCVRRIMLEQANVNFAHTCHSAGYVPCFAIGVGAEQFQGRIDNTDIPKKIAEIAGWQK